MSSKIAIVADKAPAALGPYSAAVRIGNMLYCAGQTPIDPATGELVEGCAACQTTQVLKNITAVLEAAGLTLDNVVKTTVFLTDMGDFAKMNGVYAEYFAEPFPARSTVAVAALPKAARVEIEVIASF
ncbi:MAG: RidA family protein, partial [Coriobacteriia bacterium]|nr:RidA family protein [Coriobacteriia bacterium]